MFDSVFNKIKKAAEHLDGIVHNTPVMKSTKINKITGKKVYFKCENLQKAGAFKIRGAYNAISQLDDKQKSNGVITHSSGNHAQAVALSGKLLNIPTTIVMPNNAPKVKIKATKEYGADVVLSQPTLKSREQTCDDLIDKYGYTLIHPYDNDMIIAGAGTASKELLENHDLDAIIAPVGGGGLMSGTGIFAKNSGLVNGIFGAEPIGANDAKRGIERGKRVTEQDPKTIADGLRTLLSPRTFEYISNTVDRIFDVSDKQIIRAMELIWTRMKLVVEPSGAVPLAAVLSNNNMLAEYEKIGLIISGGNIDLSDFFNNLGN